MSYIVLNIYFLNALPKMRKIRNANFAITLIKQKCKLVKSDVTIIYILIVSMYYVSQLILAWQRIWKILLKSNKIQKFFCSPVPASPLVLIIAAPSAILRNASPRFLAPHTKGTLNLFPRLSTWCSSSAGDRTTI